MQKPLCPKCGSQSTYLEMSKYAADEVYLACYTCGWRLYGESPIRAFVNEFNKNLQSREEELRVAAAKEKEREELKAIEDKKTRAKTLKRERDRRYRARKRAEALRIKAEKAESEKVHIIPAHGISFRVGEIDPVLQVPWAAPVPNLPGENLDPCAWPPCQERARQTSKYCSRKCGVKVAHQRDKLRKQGKLKEQIAS